jgi:hypothetical protein
MTFGLSRKKFPCLSLDSMWLVVRRDRVEEAAEIHGEGVRRAAKDARVVRVVGLKVQYIDSLTMMTPSGPRGKLREPRLAKDGPDLALDCRIDDFAVHSRS